MEKESIAIFAGDVREMNERVTELSRTYAIFSALINRHTYKRYQREINNHRDFFETIANSLFQGFCVITYQLFDSGKRGDVKSLPVLINYLSSLDPKIGQKLRLSIDAQRPLLDKFFSFRHKVFAHRDKSQPPWEIFGTQPRSVFKTQMKAIVHLSQNIISELADTAGLIDKKVFIGNIRRRETFAGKDTFVILQTLKKLNH